MTAPSWCPPFAFPAINSTLRSPAGVYPSCRRLSSPHSVFPGTPSIHLHTGLLLPDAVPPYHTTTPLYYPGESVVRPTPAALPACLHSAATTAVCGVADMHADLFYPGRTHCMAGTSHCSHACKKSALGTWMVASCRRSPYDHHHRKPSAVSIAARAASILDTAAAWSGRFVIMGAPGDGTLGIVLEFG